MPPPPAPCRPCPCPCPCPCCADINFLLPPCRVQARLSKLRDAETGDLQERAELQDALIKSEEMRLSLARLLIDAQVSMGVCWIWCRAAAPPVTLSPAPPQMRDMVQSRSADGSYETFALSSVPIMTHSHALQSLCPLLLHPRTRWTPMTRRACGPRRDWTWRSASQRWRPGECVCRGWGGGAGTGGTSPSFSHEVSRLACRIEFLLILHFPLASNTPSRKHAGMLRSL